MSLLNQRLVAETQNLVPNEVFFEVPLISPIIANETLYKKSF